MTNMAPVRWQRDQSRRGRVFDTGRATHPAASVLCLFCLTELGARPWQFFVIDAPVDARWHTADAVIVHAACLDRVPDEQLDRVASKIGPEPGMRR